MSRLDRFDKHNCDMLKREIIANLRELSEKYSLEITSDGGRYREEEYTLRLRINIVNENGESTAKATWARYAPIYGFAESDFGKTFAMNGRIFEITGWAPRRTKRPVEAEEISTKKQYIFEYNRVQFLLRTQGEDHEHSR